MMRDLVVFDHVDETRAKCDDGVHAVVAVKFKFQLCCLFLISAAESTKQIFPPRHSMHS